MSVVRAFLFSVSACLSLSCVLCFVCLFGQIIACSLFWGKKKTCALDTVKMIFIFLFRVEPCCAGLFSLSFSLRSLVLFLGEEKKVFCFNPLYMHIIDNNNVVTDDAGSWWLVFVKAKMWFGSGRDYASLSSSGGSLNQLSVWFCPLILRSWFGILTFDSNCIFA